MSSPQIRDAPIEPRVGADVRGGITRSAASFAGAGADSRLDDWVAGLPVINLSMPEAKAPLDESNQPLLRPASIRVNHRLIQIALPCSMSYATASESRKVGTVSEFSTNKSMDRRNGLSENKSCPSDPDFSRAEHDINEGRAKTSAAWVAATAAPHHATGNRDLLSGFLMEHDDLFVHAADGVPRKVLARGAVITDAVVLPDVWFVPGLTGNLVSVSQLTELDHSIGFGHGECCIRSAQDGKIVGKGRLQKRGVYVLDFLKIPLAI